jgi:hypothetical protein
MGGLYDNVPVLDNDILIFRRFEIPLRLCACAQLLDSIHHLILLAQECVS